MDTELLNVALAQLYQNSWMSCKVIKLINIKYISFN